MRQLKITKGVLSEKEAAFEKYLKEIHQEKSITIKEEVKLAQQVKNGDEEAFEKLKAVNNRYITIIAKHYKKEDGDLSDLIDSGNEGLKKAAEMFDETRKFSFISYATWWIKTSISQTIAEKHHQEKS